MAREDGAAGDAAQAVQSVRSSRSTTQSPQMKRPHRSQTSTATMPGWLGHVAPAGVGTGGRGQNLNGNCTGSPAFLWRGNDIDLMTPPTQPAMYVPLNSSVTTPTFETFPLV